LNNGGAVQSQRSGNVATETGNTDSHVPRVSQIYQDGCERTYRNTGKNDSLSG
jgi:hypothetical protein